MVLGEAVRVESICAGMPCPPVWIDSLERKGSQMSGATKEPMPYVKCSACINGPDSSAQISRIHTLMAVSKEPMEKPLMPAKINSCVKLAQWGITASVTPIRVRKKTKVNWRLIYLKRKPPATELTSQHREERAAAVYSTY